MKRLVLLAGIWGWSFLFIKVAVEGMPPAAVAFGRVALGAIVVGSLLRLRGDSMPRDRQLWAHFAFVGFFGSALPFTLLAWGEERITSALTAVLNATTPMFTAVAAAWVLRDRLRAVQVGGLVLGLTGVMLAAGFGTSDLSHSSLSGSAAAIVAGASYGLAFAWMRRFLTGIPPMVAAAGQLAAASLLLLPLAAGTSAASGISLNVGRVVSLVLLGVMGTGIAYVINYRVIADLGATRASLVTYLVPVVAVTAGVVVLGEPFEATLLVGGLLIVTGIGLVHERIWPAKAALLRAPAVAVVLVLAVGALSGCGGGRGDAASCDAPQRERLDTNLGHLLPGASEPRYLSDPPTSGQHQPSGPIRGLVDEPISRPIQVGQLEEGAVLIQYRNLDADKVKALEPLADRELVAVAPNPNLPEGFRVVATAWIWKQSCRDVDVKALESFVSEHAGKGPGHS